MRENPNPIVAHVRLVQSSAIPSLKGQFLKVQAMSTLPESRKSQVLFEPKNDVFESYGLSSHEAVISVCEDGCMYVPVQNCEGVSVHLEEGIDIGLIRVVGKVGTELNSCEFKNSFNGECEVDVSEDGQNVSGESKGRHCDVVNEENGGNESLVACSDGNCVNAEGSLIGVCARVHNGMSERMEKLIEALALSVDKFSESENQQLHDLIHEFSDVFALDDSELGCTDIVYHVIETGDHPPIKQQAYRTPAVHREKIAIMIADMEKQGIICPSSSPWASPVVLVPKKDGQLRFCIDYRRLNAVTKKDVYPLPRIDDILDHLGKAKYFTSLNLASGYWQVKLDENSRQKSAFTTHCGLYEFVRMPFGLCNAPATFQRLMQVVLAGLEWSSCFVYLDDILIVSQSFDEHLKHLREVFNRLCKALLKLKPKKCLILRSEVQYLGHVVTAEGIRPNLAKVEKVMSYAVPTDTTGVRRFLGLASYYRRFIPNFAKIAHPLHALIKKHTEFHWTSECAKAFHQQRMSHVSPCIVLSCVWF